LSNKLSYKNFLNLFILWGFYGGLCPPMLKNGYSKAKGLISGWVGKIRNNRNFGITGQGTLSIL